MHRHYDTDNGVPGWDQVSGRSKRLLLVSHIRLEYLQHSDGV